MKVSWRTDERTNGRTDGRTDICASWAAFAAEKVYHLLSVLHGTAFLLFFKKMIHFYKTINIFWRNKNVKPGFTYFILTLHWWQNLRIAEIFLTFLWIVLGRGHFKKLIGVADTKIGLNPKKNPLLIYFISLVIESLRYSQNKVPFWCLVPKVGSTSCVKLFLKVF